MDREDIFRTIVENSHAGIFLVDEAYSFVYVNDELCRLLGYSRPEILGQDFRKFLDDESLKIVVDRYIRRQWGEKVPSRYEFNIIRKDGEKRRVEIISSIVKNKSGNVMTVAQILDITEQKKAEETLILSEEKYRNLIEMSPDAIVTMDMEGVITSCNAFFTQATGYTKKDIVGEHFQDLGLLPIEDIPKYREMVRFAAEGKTLKRFEIRWRHRDGTPFLAELRASFIKENGRIAGIQIVARDITERKMAEEKIKTSLKEKEVMLKEIHHRVKNNMQIISSLLRLQSRQIKNEEIREIFNVSQNRINSMALIHESLYQSKDLANINLSDYVRRLTNRLLSLYKIGPNQIRLTLNVEDVYLDINRAIPCGLIINELVSNALLHGFPEREKGTIEVKMCKNEGERHRLVVRDSGVGISETEDPLKPKRLGLQLVTDLVRQLNGSIDFNRAEGTEFQIVF